MPEKIKYVFVKKQFEQRGFTLTSKEYKNAHELLFYTCKNGHKTQISWNSFQQGKGCRECSGSKKKEYEFVKKSFMERGFILISEEYIETHTPLFCYCPNNHKIKISWNSFSRGHGCGECAITKKKDYLFVKQEFEKQGYKLISKKYENAHKLLKYFCPQHHKGSISWNSFKNGSRCAKCQESKKEKQIFNLLKFSKMVFESEIRFLNCKSKRQLPFDFGIRVDSKKWILIECQGEQHYEPRDFAGRGAEWAQKEFEELQKRDQIKRDFCARMSYDLVEIPYWMKESEIQELLENIKGCISL